MSNKVTRTQAPHILFKKSIFFSILIKYAGFDVSQRLSTFDFALSDARQVGG